MLTKTPLTHSDLKINTTNTFTRERLKSRSKLDKRIIKIIKENSPPLMKKEFKTIDSYSQRKLKIKNSQNFIKNNKNKRNDKMPFIPNIERQKAETNFIKLINALVNSRKNDKNKYKNFVNDNKKYIPYKPKGYKYYEYIRENPTIIKNDNDNVYSKVINNLKRDSEIDNPYTKDFNKCYKSFNVNKLTKTSKKLNVSPNDDKIKPKIKLNPIIKYNYENLHTISVYNDINNYIPRSDRLNHMSLDCSDSTKNYNTLTNRNDNTNTKYNNNKQKDYKQSDIFNLINDNLSKNKSSEKYLFRKNYFPQPRKKTNICDIGWSPKEHYISRIGCSSVAFNILSPHLKSFSQMKKDIDLSNKNNFNKVHVISEYIDMCRVGEMNLREDFKDKLNENKNIFHRKNYCAAYNDLHHEYKDLVNDIF